MPTKSPVRWIGRADPRKRSIARARSTAQLPETDGARISTQNPYVTDRHNCHLPAKSVIKIRFDYISAERTTLARAADPVIRQRKRLDTELTKTSAGITRMIQAFSEQLITIDELRTRMPDLRARQTNLRHQIQALDTHLADQKAYLTLAHNLEDFLTQLHDKANTATITQRQQVLRLVVKDILVGPNKITIRHHIPI
jgi:hypothetical protein